MSKQEARARWAAAQTALETLDTIRPNPKKIQSSTIEVEHRITEPHSEYYSATTSDGRKYCFVDCVTADEGALGLYYKYRGGYGLTFQNTKIQKELAKRGFKDKLDQLEYDHDGREGRPKLTEKTFLDFMTENDILVPGPLPAPIETEVQGQGTALWMPEYLFRLTPYYG